MEADVYAILLLLIIALTIYKDLRILELEEKVERLNLEYNKTWDVLRTYNPKDIELEYIGFTDVEDCEDG